MKIYKANDIVIYTDKEGKRYDTFVIYDTDRETGLTHINHFNLKVSGTALDLHPRALTGNQMPMADPLSFALFNYLKEKYTDIDKAKSVKKTSTAVVHYSDPEKGSLLKKAS